MRSCQMVGSAANKAYPSLRSTKWDRVIFSSFFIASSRRTSAREIFASPRKSARRSSRCGTAETGARASPTTFRGAEYTAADGTRSVSALCGRRWDLLLHRYRGFYCFTILGGPDPRRLGGFVHDGHPCQLPAMLRLGFPPRSVLPR